MTLLKGDFPEHSLSGLWCYSGHIHELKINYEKDFLFHLNLLILSQNWFCVCNSAFFMHPDPRVSCKDELPSENNTSSDSVAFSTCLTTTERPVWE